MLPGGSGNGANSEVSPTPVESNRRSVLAGALPGWAACARTLPSSTQLSSAAPMCIVAIVNREKYRIRDCQLKES